MYHEWWESAGVGRVGPDSRGHYRSPARLCWRLGDAKSRIPPHTTPAGAGGGDEEVCSPEWNHTDHVRCGAPSFEGGVRLIWWVKELTCGGGVGKKGGGVQENSPSGWW